MTTHDEALAAVGAGADAIGMILYAPGAPRQIDADSARKIAMALPPFVTGVGVVIDCPSNRVRQLLAHIPLSAVQFGGRESLQDVRSAQPTPAIKKLSLGADLATQARTWAQAIIPNLSGLLLEGDVAWLHGVDRSQLPPLILAAGGMEPQTIATLVGNHKPWGIDLGELLDPEGDRLSEARIAESVAAVRAADLANP